MMETDRNFNKPLNEIELIDLIKLIWRGRLTILRITILFVILSFIIAFTTQKQFTVEVRLLPELRDSRGSASQMLRQISGLSGLSIPAAESYDAISPNLYPEILNSSPFFLYLFDKDISVETDSGIERVSAVYFTDKYIAGSFWRKVRKYTIRFPWTVLGWFRNNNENPIHDISGNIEALAISPIQLKVMKEFRERISAGLDQKTGLVKISAEFPDPYAAADIAHHTVEYLADYVTQYRSEKARRDMEFIKERYEEKRIEFHHAQINLANFRDANLNIVSAAARTEGQRLEDQYNLSFSVYSGLAQQLEQNRIKVQETTPVIKILDPVQVPLESSKPKRSLIIILFFFTGIITGIGFTIIRHAGRVYLSGRL